MLGQTATTGMRRAAGNLSHENKGEMPAGNTERDSDKIMNLKFWTWGPAPRPVRAANTKAVTEAELAGRFASAPDNPLWEATLTLLAEKINTTATEAADERLTDRQVLWRIAGASALMEFLEDLQERERQARQMQQEREQEKT